MTRNNAIQLVEKTFDDGSFKATMTRRVAADRKPEPPTGEPS